MISIRSCAVVVLALGVVSCTVGPEVREGPIGPWVLSAGTGTLDASSRFGCTLSVSVGLPDSVPENWDGLAHWSSYRRYTDTLSRELDGGITQFYMRDWGTDSLQIVVVSEVRSDTLRGTSVSWPGGGEANGAWVCGSDFPLAADSALVTAGQDSLAVKDGQWQFFKVVYFD